MDQRKRRLGVQRGGQANNTSPPADLSFMRQVADARRRQAIIALPERLRELTDVAERLTAAVIELRTALSEIEKATA